MPKIVPDVHNKILSVAEAHFKAHGFEKTDMREVASQAGLAVGTIYLHYRNKETLYLHVLRHCWIDTFEKVEELSASDIDPEQKLRQVLLELVQSMDERKTLNSLWMEIGSLHHHPPEDHPSTNHFSGLREPFSRVISQLLKEITNRDNLEINDRTLEQLGSFVFIMTVDACMQGHETNAENIKLILDLVKAYLSSSK
jgi:AcrR family transcriptional regulator